VAVEREPPVFAIGITAGSVFMGFVNIPIKAPAPNVNVSAVDKGSLK
jgi:hypothetical protein